MRHLTGNEIRSMFLKYFEKHGHMVEPGASLVPHNDPTLLWINAGVAALKKYFDGSEKPTCPRICNAQKSIRTNDIENVGKTARHHTFFEMLGNFSIGDYFKREAIHFAWEFLTSEEYIGFDKNRIYITVYIDDEEAYDIWTKEIGVDPAHILKTAGNFNNEIGLPLTIFNIRDEHEVAVLEMGISDFGEMHRLSKIARPNLCIITNIGLCHLEFLGDRDGVLRAKSEIFDFAAAGAKAIVNGDDDKLSTLKSREDLDVTLFGMDSSNDVYAKQVENLGLDGLKCVISTPVGEFSAHIHIPGMHMVYNALAGTCVGLACGLTLEEIKSGIENAQTISGRNNLIHTENYTIMDDCYNANPVSMKASLDVLSTALG